MIRNIDVKLNAAGRKREKMMTNNIHVFLLLVYLCQLSYTNEIPEMIELPLQSPTEDIDSEGLYRSVAVVNGPNGQNYKTFSRNYKAEQAKAKDLYDGNYREATLEENEIELDDVEYREDLAEQHDVDANHIWKSSKLETFLKKYPGIKKKRKGKGPHNWKTDFQTKKQKTEKYTQISFTALLDKITKSRTNDEKQSSTPVWRTTESNKGGQAYRRRKRVATNDESKYWPKATVPYVWSEDFDDETQSSKMAGAIRAMNHVAYWTCVRFVEWHNQTNINLGLGHDGRLKFKAYGGCSSFVGSNSMPNGQPITCCMDRPCVHELSHAIGLYHEQRSPLHQDFIRITRSSLDLDMTPYLSYREISPTLAKTYGRYDVTSIMHYGAFFGHNDFQAPMTVLDSDDHLLLINGDPTDFYMFDVISDISNCVALRCSDTSLSCQNWGYPSFIKDKCQCRCIEGLDPYSGCTSLYKTDLTLVGQWPPGSFTLLKPITGCPNGFVEGLTRYKTLYTSESHENNAYMEHDGKIWTQRFCTKPLSDSSSGAQWGPGKYCIYRHGGKCPAGFTKGTVLIDTLGTAFIDGVQPDGDYTNDVMWKFCCRSDGRLVDPISLPNKEPLIMFQQTSYGCQKIDGMTDQEQYFRVRNVDSTVAYKMGSTPRVRKSYRNYYFYFCYYQPKAYDITELYSRWPNEPFSMIRSQDGCPDGFAHSSIRQKTEPVKTSEHSYADITVGSDDIVYNFCSKPPSKNLGESYDWQKGSYCILKYQGECPKGFNEGTITFDDNAPIETRSFLPDGSFSEDLTLEFCCREDGMWADPISLPLQSSFVLFRHYNFPCQKVKDMIDSEEYIRVKNADTNQQLVSGSIPRLLIEGRHYQLHYCHYFHPDTECCAMYELTASNPTIAVASPNFPGPYTSRKKCNYLFKGPEGSQFILKFDSFDIESTSDGECVSSVGIRNRLPGQPEIKYCGDRFDHTVITLQNFLGISFTSLSNDKEKMGFSATVRLITDQDMCYTNNGTTYAGKVNVTKKFQKCLNWYEVTHCERSLYGRSDSASLLEKNCCRKAGSGTAPWCYTDADQCTREYCDVCNLGNCYDVFLDCDELLLENSNFCSEDEEAPRGCRKTCGLCSSDVPEPVSKVHCTTPAPLLDSVPTTFLKTKYNVGETVILKCLTGNETETRTCLADGTWSGGHFVCGRCPTGWSSFEGSCYKWYDVYMTFDEGKAFCASQGGVITSAKNTDENKFIQKLRNNDRSFWLGIEQSGNTHIWTEDGSRLTWTNWGQEEEDTKYACVNVKEDGKWNGWGCNWDYFSIICKFKPSARRDCLDYRNDCEELLRDDPGMCGDQAQFAEDNCPKTCGMCGPVTTCKRPPVPSNSIQTTGGEILITRGTIFSYECIAGYAQSEGNNKRACLMDGTLTGKPIVCLHNYLVQSRNNELSMRPRSLLDVERKMFIGDNEAMRIHKTGKVVAWEFYSMVNCEVTFGVWRRVQQNRYSLVGRNTITKSRHDRKRKYDVPTSEQIKALQGDIIGVYFAYGKGACVPYDLCKLNLGKYGNQMVSMGWKGQASKWIIGETYDFKTLTDKTQCKKWSFSAVVQ